MTVQELELVAALPGVTVAVVGTLSHRCPYRDELDHGHVTLTWRTRHATVELHSLATWLKNHSHTRCSHEDLTEYLRQDLEAQGLTDVHVSTAWRTAGLEVQCATTQTPAVRQSGTT